MMSKKILSLQRFVIGIWMMMKILYDFIFVLKVFLNYIYIKENFNNKL